jgi:3-oxoacyl-[acyl-carrier-protein] synthase-3
MNIQQPSKITPLKLPTKIISVGTHLPETKLRSRDIFLEFDSENRYDMSYDLMVDSMGIEERRVSKPGTLPSELAIPAARAAIEKLQHVNADDIDMVIFCGIERDQSEPATAHTIQHALGLKADHAFDVSNACYGFLHGVEIATNYMLAGTARYALICTGEVPSRVLRAALDLLKRGVTKQRAQQIIGGLSVGDAGGAVILGPNEIGETSGFKLFNTKTDSSLVDKCLYRVNSDGSISGQMEMGKIVGASIWQHRKIIQETLDKLGWDKFDWLLSHQTGRRPFEKFGEFSTVDPDRRIRTYPKLGNITTATFPFNFKKLLEDDRVTVGDRIGGIHSGSGLVIGEFGYTF